MFQEVRGLYGVSERGGELSSGLSQPGGKAVEQFGGVCSDAPVQSS